MAKIVFSNIIGVFVLENRRILDKKIFKNTESANIESAKNQKEYERQLLEKYPDAVKAKEMDMMAAVFPKIKEFRDDFYNKNMEIAVVSIRGSVTKDNLIIHAITNIEDLTRTINHLSKRLREWYGLYFPELGEKIGDNEKFAELVCKEDKERLIRELKIDSLGANLTKRDVTPMIELAKGICNLVEIKNKEAAYLNTIMSGYCPNLAVVAEVNVGAELIKHTGSIKKLAVMPSSTIQLLGAEKALFRHLKTKSKSPKQGLIINHPLLANAKENEKGKIARHLASAISIACRVDYFGGNTNTGYKLREKVEKFVKNLK